MEWIKIANQMPPEDTLLLFGGLITQTILGRYEVIRWKPYDEDLAREEGLLEQEIIGVRRASDYIREHNGRSRVVCSCEDTNWPLSEFTYWSHIDIEKPK